MANFIWFITFPIFSHRSNSEWLRMANFTWFATFQIFPTEAAQNYSECPILRDSQHFQIFPTEVAQNVQFLLIHNFSTFSPPKWLRMTWNGQLICLIHNFSNLDHHWRTSEWLGMANFAWFATFPIQGQAEVAQNVSVHGSIFTSWHLQLISNG